ncbi:hypothetical protein VK92_02900 [Burkholderia sp. LK4]|nr:hypothetical protein VL00_13745 [Burkholderia cepacia]KML42221.1 hypothetical protein VL13_11120 [Burkholderia lata]KMN62267.1 hypothetical protein VK92_02900 [Burkholderia sp. LK4]
MSWSAPAWFTIIGTLCGALITAGATLLNHRLTRRHEQAKLAEQRAHELAKLAEQRAPAQIEAALMLEGFARQAVRYYDQCEVRINNWYARQHGDEPDEERKWEPLAFDLSAVKDWSVVPIDILSQCLELPTVLAESAAWTNAASNEEWMDVDDGYWLECQRAILYGLLAGELAHQVRGAINVPASALATDAFVRLKREFDKLKSRYVELQGKIDLIPDLKTRLQRECPEVVMKPFAVPSSVSS